MSKMWQYANFKFLSKKGPAGMGQFWVPEGAVVLNSGIFNRFASNLDSAKKFLGNIFFLPKFFFTQIFFYPFFFFFSFFSVTFFFFLLENFFFNFFLLNLIQVIYMLHVATRTILGIKMCILIIIINYKP